MHIVPPRKLEGECLQCQAAHVLELTRANQKLENFVLVASHDLRTPLRAMISLIEWVRDDLKSAFGALPDNIEADLSELSAQGQRMRRFLQDLLEFTQVSSTGEASENLDELALIQDCIQFCAVPSSFSVVISDDFPDVHCSRAEFAVVMRNLISNSIKFHDQPEGRIEIDGWAQDGFGYFRVRDDGPGVDEKYSEQIFEMFKTLDSNRGSGIGLGMVKAVTEKYGGQACVSPNPQGRGSDFIFSFPLSKPPEAATGTVRRHRS